VRWLPLNSHNVVLRRQITTAAQHCGVNRGATNLSSAVCSSSYLFFFAQTYPIEAIVIFLAGNVTRFRPILLIRWLKNSDTLLTAAFCSIDCPWLFPAWRTPLSFCQLTQRNGWCYNTAVPVHKPNQIIFIDFWQPRGWINNT